jgi:hypothetical protein
MTSHQNIKRLNDWVAETPESIAARLEGAKASQAQIRLTIGIMAVISTMMLIASYNAYLSYDYGWTLDVVDRQLPAEKTVAGVLTEQALRDWASSRIVESQLLGIRMSVDDAAVLGALVLLVLSLWLLLLARRENHTIGFLLRDTDSPDPTVNRDSSTMQTTENRPKMYFGGERWLIFHTIISNNLFVTCDPSLSTVQSLNGPTPLQATAIGRFKGWLNKVGFGLARSFFFFFPMIASFTVFSLERLSYFLRDPFLPEGAAEGTDRPFYWVSLIVFVVCWLLLTVCCWKSNRYSRATEKVLGEYGRKLRVDLLQQEQTSKLNDESSSLVLMPVRLRHLS